MASDTDEYYSHFMSCCIVDDMHPLGANEQRDFAHGKEYFYPYMREIRSPFFIILSQSCIHFFGKKNRLYITFYKVLH